MPDFIRWFDSVTAADVPIVGHIGICGQAPSDYPDFAEILVRIGIDSISPLRGATRRLTTCQGGKS